MGSIKISMNRIFEMTVNVVSAIFLTVGWGVLILAMFAAPVLTILCLRDRWTNPKEQELPPCIEVTIEEDDHGPLVEKIGPYLEQGYVVSIVWPHEESMSSTLCFQKWDGQQQTVRKNRGQ